ncbi:hydrogenase expression/formation protein HypE [Desulfocicer vacuolatum DSM 3385]|uniref:Hydrogenase expression/formation protein HypE n=1 Tax=Desulfocicer vacuolatum DSM 3385 TaxID=1121400 RepID=A0A1W1YN88_9BACT|nr:hydrogenase expression/formation protein HypE [Desulfocicer vacuolatum]SMC37614.1 hydrogenase expression/formation protein HypE [Desulfocicer vacuolatum DSM 3385]
MGNDKVLLDHGSGGKISHAMISNMILPAFNNPVLNRLDDGAVLEMNGGRVAFSTDSYVVDPIFFPGGNIGDLAINGTVNDVAMCGAIPEYVSVGLILEEGFSSDDLSIILQSMARAAQKAGVQVVTGDTKVVPRGKADKIFINTSGFGIIPPGIHLSGSSASPGDRVIISGTVADHGITVLTAREGLGIDSEIETDSAPLNHMVKEILKAAPGVHVLRDPTRGGVGTTLNEIAAQSGVGIRIKEQYIPLKGAVLGMCELLGFDPLYIANEGKLLAVVAPEDTDAALRAIQNSPFGRDAAVIGEVTAEDPGKVFLETVIGGARIVDMLAGDQLPRIC